MFAARPASPSCPATSSAFLAFRAKANRPTSPQTRILSSSGPADGACYVDEIARGLDLRPSVVREALNALLRRGLVHADRLDPLRSGTDAPRRPSPAPIPSATAAPASAPSAARPRIRAEPRWAVLASSPESDAPEASALAWAEALLGRYGVLSRETVALDPWAPPWRDLAPHLARAELRGELRRGYFVEGLSGIQYALAETAEQLARLGDDPDPSLLLLSSLDPANLYGSGAPFDIPLLEGGTARLTRSASNFLVLLAGRPVLIIEAHGRRLTGLASASEPELRSALALLPALIGPGRRVLKVETYNTAPTLASPAAPWLADLGFVRDFPGMAFYAGWSTATETQPVW